MQDRKTHAEGGVLLVADSTLGRKLCRRPTSMLFTLTLSAQSTQIWGIYGFYTRNRNNGFGNVYSVFGYVDPYGLRVRVQGPKW